MKVLVACEESQEVCKAFRALGHEAYSCDIQEPSGGHPKWHILGDALKSIEGGQVTTMDGRTHDVGKWDMIIAFPPCTKTSNAGARHLYRGGKLNIVEPTATWCPSSSYSHKHGDQHNGMFTTDRAKNRAKTFPGIARAMAEQWGGDIREE